MDGFIVVIDDAEEQFDGGFIPALDRVLLRCEPRTIQSGRLSCAATRCQPRSPLKLLRRLDGDVAEVTARIVYGSEDEIETHRVRQSAQGAGYIADYRWDLPWRVRRCALRCRRPRETRRHRRRHDARSHFRLASRRGRLFQCDRDTAAGIRSSRWSPDLSHASAHRRSRRL